MPVHSHRSLPCGSTATRRCASGCSGFTVCGPCFDKALSFLMLGAVGWGGGGLFLVYTAHLPTCSYIPLSAAGTETLFRWADGETERAREKGCRRWPWAFDVYIYVCRTTLWVYTHTQRHPLIRATTMASPTVTPPRTLTGSSCMNMTAISHYHCWYLNCNDSLVSRLPYIISRFANIYSKHVVLFFDIWAVVKMRVPFWVPIIVRRLIFRVPKKGP